MSSSVVVVAVEVCVSSAVETTLGEKTPFQQKPKIEFNKRRGVGLNG